MPRTRSTVLAERAVTARGLGTRLAAAREQAGITQAAAAKALGIPQSRVAKLELGIRQLGFLEGLRLAAVYGVDPTELQSAQDGRQRARPDSRGLGDRDSALKSDG